MRETVLPETLLRIRAARDLTQDQLAERLGVTRVTVSNWERGAVSVPPVKAVKIRMQWPEECR